MNPFKRYGALFLTAFAFFSIVAPMGNLPSDTEYSIATAESIVLRGSLAVPYSQHLQYLKPGRGGSYYSKYGVGYALLFTLPVAAAETAGRIAPSKKEYLEQFVVSFTNTFFAAAIIVLFVMIFTALGYPRRLSLISAAFIAAGSILLPYSKIIHAETPSALLMLLSIFIALKNTGIDAKTGFLLGLCASCLMAIKPGNIPYSLVIGGYVVFLSVKQRKGLSVLVSCAMPCILTAGVLAALNILRFGNPFETGYGTEQWQFTTPLPYGLAGLLFSPSKSMFLFSPLLLPCLIAFPRLYKKSPAVALCGLAMAAGATLFYAAWHDWFGGWAWGPRLVVPAIILLHLSLPEFLIMVRGSRVCKAFFAALLVFAAAVNVLGSLVWYQQICHFSCDYASVKNSHPVVAAKLLLNKIRNRPEVYACRDFGLDCGKTDYAAIFQVKVHGDSLDFSDFEKFQGLATMWDGVRRNFHIPFLWMIPLLLLTGSAAGFLRLLRPLPAKDTPSV